MDSIDRSTFATYPDFVPESGVFEPEGDVTAAYPPFSTRGRPPGRTRVSGRGRPPVYDSTDP